MKIRPQIRRVLRDLKADDEDIATYAAMSVLRLKEITEVEIAELLPELRHTTTNDSISVRFFSKKALNEVKLQMARYPRFREEYEQLKEETKRASWHDLLTNLEKESTDSKLVVLDYLRDIEDPLLPDALKEFIRTEGDPFVLAESIKVLGFVGSKDSVDFLEEYLSHSDSRIRSNAVEAMAEIGGKQVMYSILPLLEDDDNRVKATVAKICSQYGDHQVVATLATMIHSVEIWMRESATYALGYVPCGESVDLLLEAVCDVNPEIQRKSIESLGKLGAKRARDFLMSIIGAADPAIAESAQKALARIKKEMKDYDYFDPARADSANLVEALATRRRAKRREGLFGSGEQAAEGGGEQAPAEDTLTTRAMRLVGSSKKEEEEALEMLVKQRGDLMAELGKRALERYREGDFDRPYLTEYSSEVKKLRYLIEQKEGQKKVLKDESNKSTFLSFIKESVSRFTQERQVDSRMEALNSQLRDTHMRLGQRLMKDFPTDGTDAMMLDDLPTILTKLERQIESLQRTLT